MQLNTIFYGPPGTGKTYQLQALIADLKLEQPEMLSPVLDYQSFAAGYKWWELLAMVLVEVKRISVPDLLKHPLLTAKFSLSSIQHWPQRLWSTLQHHTVESCPNVKSRSRFGELIFYKEVDSSWRLDSESDFKQQYPFLVTAWEEFKKGGAPKKSDRHFTFITCHQSLTYEDFIEGIKPSLQEGDEASEDEKGKIEYEVRRGLFYEACDKAARRAGFVNLSDALQADKKKREEAFQKANNEGNIHVLFLDEISRCNIAAVFGELITLIEEDKRLGAGHEMAYVKLPYSQKEFGVPSNLFIIGTMNTADRSVEALDTALRRRFVFEEMSPNPDLLSSPRLLWRFLWKYKNSRWIDADFSIVEQKAKAFLGIGDDFEKSKGAIWEKWVQQGEEEREQVADLQAFTFDGIDMSAMLSAINGRLAILLSKDHVIGHAWLMDVYSLEDLQKAFNTKIIPLLQEYFYNDYAKIGLVLGDAFFDRQIKVHKKVFAAFRNGAGLADDYSEKLIYSLKGIDTLTINDFKSIY